MRNSALDEVLEREVYQQPALMPPSPWLGRARPGKPKLTVASGESGLPTGNPLGAERLRQGLALAAADASRRPVDKGDTARGTKTTRVWNGAPPEVGGGLGGQSQRRDERPQRASGARQRKMIAARAQRAGAPLTQSIPQRKGAAAARLGAPRSQGSVRSSCRSARGQRGQSRRPLPAACAPAAGNPSPARRATASRYSCAWPDSASGSGGQRRLVPPKRLRARHDAASRRQSTRAISGNSPASRTEITSTSASAAACTASGKTASVRSLIFQDLWQMPPWPTNCPTRSHNSVVQCRVKGS